MTEASVQTMGSNSWSLMDVGEAIKIHYLYALKNKKRPAPCFVHGSPGIGKTEVIYELVDQIDKVIGNYGFDHVNLFVLSTAGMEPCDITGIPFKSACGRFADYMAPRWVEQAAAEGGDNNPSIFFWDDFSVASKGVQAACFKLLGENRTGNVILRNDTFHILSGNSVDDKNSGANRLLTPVANRARHFYIDKSKLQPDWIEWAQRTGKIHPIIVAYLRATGSASRFCEHKTAQDDYAFRTPRTWEMASDVLFSMEAEGSEKNLEAQIAGVVGQDIAGEFMDYREFKDQVIPVNMIVENPTTCQVPDDANIGLGHLTMSLVEYHLHNNPGDWQAIMHYVLRDDMPADVGVVIAKAAFKALQTQDDWSDVIMEEKTFGDLVDKTLKRYGDLMVTVDKF